ncbi:MAG: hypothetical protein M1833_005186 [Piccolia ochrophora]|nr:MAG: hypothetical protein M1833_005186 [Piccolia ochrophora]
MAPLVPRFHLFEIDDQAWFPQTLREKVQSCLTLFWTFRLPLLQTSSPAAQVTSVLLHTLSHSIRQYTFVDYCAGAGGPTPTIERLLNSELTSTASSSSSSTAGMRNGDAPASDGDEPVKFLLTDICPHVEAWEALAKKSDNLGYVAEPVDAAAPGARMLGKEGRKKKEFRLFSLAFHHFDDALAGEILRSTLEGSDGFGIFELQDRTFSSLLTVTLLGPLLLLLTPFFFWRSPTHLLFTYLLPIVPFVIVFDGYVSSLRTRTTEEVLQLASGNGRIKGWKIRSGRELHTWPLSYMHWIVGVRE